MLIVKERKALILKTKNPRKIINVIPTAKQIKNNIIAVPFKLDEVKVLNNIGVKAPSPINYYYDWPGPFTPFSHQKKTAAFLTLQRRCLVLNDIGTGKTQSALWAADYLMELDKIKKVLIICPLSTMERVWADGIFTGLPHRKFVVLYGSAGRRAKLLNLEADFYIINHDGFAIIANKCMNMFDLVIIDEAAVYRNPSTTRFKIFNKWLSKNIKTNLWLMTGTPTPNAPTDAWALAKLIDPLKIPRSFVAFRDQVMVKVSQWKYVPKNDAVKTVQKILQPSIRFTRDECFDLPETIIQTRQVELTSEQKTHYEKMLRHLVAEIGSGTTAVNEAAKMQKLLQIVCGVVYDDSGEFIELDCAPRINLVREIIEEAGEKVIVFAPLIGVINMLEKKLSKYWSVGVVTGDVSASQRNKIFQNFQHEKDPHVLIAHPGVMAHGLTLTTASTIIWYGPITSNEMYTQANGRIERIGKKHSSNVVHIESTILERKMYDRLARKQKLQGTLLETIKQHTKEGWQWTVRKNN